MVIGRYMIKEIKILVPKAFKNMQIISFTQYFLTKVIAICDGILPFSNRTHIIKSLIVS